VTTEDERVEQSRLRLRRDQMKKNDQREEFNMCVRENFVLSSFINFEHVERFKNRRNVMKFRSFGDSMSSGI
jgi:hypothetical protein